MMDGGWSYRIFKDMVDGQPFYFVGEAYYSGKGKVEATMQEPTQPQGESRKELIQDLENMLADAKKYSTLKAKRG